MKMIDPRHAHLQKSQLLKKQKWYVWVKQSQTRLKRDDDKIHNLTKCIQQSQKNKQSN